MSLLRWDPFRNIAALQEGINRLFKDSFPNIESAAEDMAGGRWRPVVDVFEREDCIVVKAELPGIAKEDISIEIKDDALILRGQRSEESGVPKERWLLRERSCGPFQRTFHLQDTVEHELVRATFKDGVLEVRIPRPSHVKPRQVSVAVE